MLYLAEVLVPSLQSVLTPQRTVLKITAGIAREQWFMFPDGPYGLVHIQVWHHGWQVWPWVPGASFHWNNYVYHIQDRYPFTAEPFEVVIKTWSYDDFYDQPVTFAMTVDAAPPPTELAELSELLADLGLEE